MLQGPHGPFMSQLADLLSQAGCNVRRINFNAGDRYYWRANVMADDYLGAFEKWPEFFAQYCRDHNISDLVLYGDMKPYHKPAIEHAKASGITVHCFEEGYLRPRWVTYERGGVNGNSQLINISMDEIRRQRAQRTVDLRDAPMQWGALWAHKWAGFIYHLRQYIGAKSFPNYKSPRDIDVFTEWFLHFKRLLKMPYQLFKRDWDTKKFLEQGNPFFAVMLQLEHDTSFRAHSRFDSQQEFIDEVMENFARVVPSHTALVFKLHPLEDGRAGLEKWVWDAAKKHNMTQQVHVFYGGKLSSLMNRAKAVLVINSTSVQHALWRGIPVGIFGKSIFKKPEFAADQTIGDFLSAPQKGDRGAYLEFRSYLLETSQIVGGFYTKLGRAEVLRNSVDLLLSDLHSYEVQQKTN